MFLGSFKYSVDAKGRVSIPAKMRKFLNPDANDAFVMTRGSARCIVVYPMDNWKELVDSKLNNLNAFDPKDAKFMRLFLMKASEDKLDSQSRLSIPKNLLEHAGITKDVLIIGMNKFIEIWEPDEYESYLMDNDEPYEEIAKEVMQ